MTEPTEILEPEVLPADAPPRPEAPAVSGTQIGAVGGAVLGLALGKGRGGLLGAGLGALLGGLAGAIIGAVAQGLVEGTKAAGEPNQPNQPEPSGERGALPAPTDAPKPAT